MTAVEENELNQLEAERKLSQNIIKANQKRYADELMGGLGEHIKERLDHKPTRWEIFKGKVKHFFAWLS